MAPTEWSRMRPSAGTEYCAWRCGCGPRRTSTRPARLPFVARAGFESARSTDRTRRSLRHYLFAGAGRQLHRRRQLAVAGDEIWTEWRPPRLPQTCLNPMRTAICAKAGRWPPPLRARHIGCRCIANSTSTRRAPSFPISPSSASVMPIYRRSRRRSPVRCTATTSSTMARSILNSAASRGSIGSRTR